MPMRLSGLITGMDTEALVGQLMDAQKLKKKKVVGAKTKLEWKQTAWSDLNKKLTTFYNTQATKMRLNSSYNIKKANVSDSTKATISAGSVAVDGNYTLEVKDIATSQYLTGGKASFTSTSDKLVSADDKLDGKTIAVTTGIGAEKKTTNIEITADTTVNDFVNSLKKAGLNAGYDVSQRRFFISSKETGAAQAFSITTATVSGAETTNRQAVKDAIGYDSMSATDKQKADEYITTLQSTGSSGTDYEKTLGDLAKLSYDSKDSRAKDGATAYVKAGLFADHYGTAYAEASADEALKKEYFEEDGVTPKEGKTVEDYEKAVKAKASEKAAKYADENFSVESDAYLEAYNSGKTSEDIAALSEEAKAKYFSTSTDGFAGMSGVTESGVKDSITDSVRVYAAMSASDRSNPLAEGDKGLTMLGLADMSYEMGADGKVTYNYDKDAVKDMALIGASDSRIILNGAELTSSKSTVTANGLSINLVSKTAENSPINFSVASDVDAAYDNIKNALKEYNELLKEMKTLYNAASSKGYEPLTSDEKKAMSDDEVEEWEKKIKDSLLRRDQTLGGIMSSMRESMMSTVEVNGKNYSLSSFGIMTSTDYTEGGLLHIFGDSDDSVYAGKDDLLKKALTENPEDTVEALTGIFDNLRKTMFQKMGANQYSSALTFYNDKQMDEELKNYKSEIKTWEDKLADIEDQYYKKFSALETAMAKLQSQQSSLGSLFGMGS